jgi:hypothetical protein
MSWLNGRPEINKNLLVSGDYDSLRDDTTSYTVYSYPQLEYIGKFNASRFDNPLSKGEHYPPLMLDEDFTSKEPVLGIFRIYRSLYPSQDTPNQWLEIVSWGFPDLVPIDGGYNVETETTVINGDPEAFDDIVKRIMEVHKEKLYDKLYKF